MRLPRSFWAWVVAGPVLLPLLALYVILAPVVWIFKGAVRAAMWD